VEGLQSVHQLQRALPVVFQLFQQLLADGVVEHVDLGDERVDALVPVPPALDELGFDLAQRDDLMATQTVDVGRFAGLAHELLVKHTSTRHTYIDVFFVVFWADRC
jgi:hypothetical protein